MKRALLGIATLALLLYSVTAPARAADPARPDAAEAARAEQVEGVVMAAESYLGVAYRIGREGPDLFDCSGLVFRAFADAGQLSRIGGARLRAAGYMRWFGARDRFTTDAALAERGDLIIYGAGRHIGVYLGGGRVISALVSGVTAHRLDGISYEYSGVLKIDWTGDGRNPPAFDGATSLPEPEIEAPAELVPALPWLDGPAAGAATSARDDRADRHDMRTATSRTFENGDGTFTTELFSAPIHHRPAGDEGWQPIDLRFAPTGPSAIMSTAPVTLVLLPADDPDGFLHLSAGELALSIAVPPGRAGAGEAAMPVVGGDRRYADYADLLRGGVGLRVFPRADGLRAFFVLTARPRTNQISLALSAAGVAMASAANGSVVLHGADRQVAGWLPAPLMLDSSDVDGNGGGVAPLPATLAVDGTGERRRLTINLDPAFMASATYPVYVGLSVAGFPAGTADSGQAYATSRYPGLALAGYQRPEWPAYEELWHGRLPGTDDQAEAYLRFADLATTLAGVRVESAVLRFQPYWQHERADARPTWVDTAGGAWRPETLTWNSRPPRLTTLGRLATQAGAWSEVRLSDHVAGVLDGDITDHGFVLHANEASRPSWKRIVGGSETGSLGLAPRLIVTWSAPRPIADARRSLPAVPELSADGLLELSWRDPAVAPLATKYEIQVSRDGFLTVDVGSGRIGGTAGPGGAWQIPAGVLVEGVDYAWRVRVKYGAGIGWSDWSAAANFTY